MSLGFELATGGSTNLFETARVSAKPAAELAPATFEGTARGLGMGFMRGGATTARMIDLAGAVPPLLLDKLAGTTERQDQYFREHDEVFNRAVEHWTPLPHEVGAAGRIIGGLAEMTLPLIAGGGNPALLMGSTGLGTAEELVRQGVDPTTARGVGQIQSLAVGAGFKIPFLGRNLVERLAFGAASNPAVGVLAALPSHDLLKEAGHGELAKQFDPLDAEARTIELLMGLAFGGLAHKVNPRGEHLPWSISRQDALLALNNAKHADVDAAPGRPRTLDAKNDHADALTQALDDTSAGKNTTATVDPAGFEPIPRRDALRDAVRQSVHAEREAVGLAYDDVLARPHGAPDDPTVRMTPEDIGEVLLERGPELPPRGEIEVRPGGYGLLKIIWKHGERSSKAPELQVTREDIMRTPEVMRDYQPIRDITQGDGKRILEWQVERADGKRVIYAVSKFTDVDQRQHVVSIFVNNEDRPRFKNKPTSQLKNRLSPEPQPGGSMPQEPGTGAQPLVSSARGQGGGSAGTVEQGGAPGKPAGETAPLAPEVSAAQQAIAARPDLLVMTGVDAEGNPVHASARELLAQADATVAEAEIHAKAFEAAANCVLKG